MFNVSNLFIYASGSSKVLGKGGTKSSSRLPPMPPTCHMMAKWTLLFPKILKIQLLAWLMGIVMSGQYQAKMTLVTTPMQYFAAISWLDMWTHHSD